MAAEAYEKEVSQYLERHMVTALTKALTQMCHEAPGDPFMWMANWLLENNPNRAPGGEHWVWSRLRSHLLLIISSAAVALCRWSSLSVLSAWATISAKLRFLQINRGRCAIPSALRSGLG